MRAKLLAFILLMITAFAFCPAEGAEQKRTLTLMIYMCGSNLESGSAAASADFQEILNAGFDENITVLIMTGGSRQWAQGFSADQTVISEVRLNKRGKIARKTVWTEDTRNMGDASTLTALLQFGIEQYPATDYALILWDHGGGPLEGVCWDELFSMDNLQLDELTASLEEASLPQKLKWIGFDACLMSTLEVAQAVSPYAEYMIASQETEPALGWNYRFLADISRDATGAETGKRIVDAFFEGREDADETLTLACMDLSQIPAIAEEMDTLFRSAASLDEDSFVRMSSLRKDTANFGKSVLPSGEDGYDLVDLYDLAERINGSVGDCQPLLDTLSSAIVYARANMTGAHGLSVYYPYTNKIKYAGKWRENYRDVRASRQYLRYMEDFGAMLLGEETVDWSGMHGEEVAADERGNHLAMQLTPEQAGQYVSSQLMILMPGLFNTNIQQNYSLIGAFPAEMDANGLVTATFSGRVLYIDEDGQIGGPITYLIRDGQEKNLVEAKYIRGGETQTEMQNVIFMLDPSPDADGAVSSSIRVRDEATGAYTGRIEFHEDRYRRVNFLYRYKAYPGLAPREAQPALIDWEDGSNEASAWSLELPCQWRFIYQDELIFGTQLYAVFQVTDSRQNSYTSDLIPLTNRNLNDIQLSPVHVAGDGFEMTVSLRRDLSEMDRGLRLQCEITNHTDIERSYILKNVILNGHRQSTQKQYHDIAPGLSEKLDLLIPADELINLAQIDSMTVTVESTSSEYRPDFEGTSDTFTFDLYDGFLSGVSSSRQPIGEGRNGDVTVQLMQIKEDSWGGYLYADVLVENRGERSINFNGAALINDRLQLGISKLEEVSPGTSKLLRLPLQNYVDVVSPLDLEVDPEDTLTSYILEDDLIHRLNQNPITSITFLPGYGNTYFGQGNPVRLQTESPIYVEHAAPNGMVYIYRSLSSDVFTAIALSDTAQYRVDATSILTGRDAFALSLRVENKTDQSLRVTVPKDVLINGEQIDVISNQYVLAPHAETVCSVLLGEFHDLPSTEGVREIQISFACEGQSGAPASVILLPEGLRAGDYLTADQWTVSRLDVSDEQ